MAWSAKGTTPIVKVPNTRAKMHTILGAISILGVINVAIRKPNLSQSRKKRKRGKSDDDKTNKPQSKGTTTNHYIAFLRDTMDMMDQYPQMKGFYLVMDNAPIHTRPEIDVLITARGYQCVYLPPYSPELNPIEQFWAVTKSKIKRCALLDDETLTIRITDACAQVSLNDMNGFIRHSVSRFDDCLNRNPI